jgi:putative hydrolase of the HAD superfamily
VSTSRPALVVFDLDGVLVSYDRSGRVAHLGAALDRDPELVQAALFGASALEDRYDAGAMSTDDYLAELGDTLGCHVDRPTWAAARIASMHCPVDTCLRVASLAHRCEVAILSNNGAMVADILPHAIPALFPTFENRVFCSGVLGSSKPSPECFLRVVEHLGHTPQHTLFLDDNFDNVEGARSAGLFAEHVAQPGRFDAILACYNL